jgi:hypothetical protein
MPRPVGAGVLTILGGLFIMLGGLGFAFVGVLFAVFGHWSDFFLLGILVGFLTLLVGVLMLAVPSGHAVWGVLAILLSIVMCAAFAGCQIVRITLNTPLTPDDVASVVPGETPLADVIITLGAPDSMTESNTGVTATYRFHDMKYSRVNFGLLLKVWSPVDPDFISSRIGLGADAFEVLCDSHGVVTHQSFLRHLGGPRFNPYPF